MWETRNPKPGRTHVENPRESQPTPTENFANKAKMKFPGQECKVIAGTISSGYIDRHNRKHYLSTYAGSKKVISMS